jgi:hypothetical protein
MRPTFDHLPRITPAFAPTRMSVHYAAQLVAAAGVTLLPPDPAYTYSSTTFDAESGALVGSPLPGGRQVRLVVPQLRLEVLEVNRSIGLPLSGRTCR